MTTNSGQYNPKNPDAFNQVELPPDESIPLNIEQISPGQSALVDGDFISPNYRKGKAGFKISSDGSIEANNLTLYSNQENAIIIDYGGNILMKEGGSIKFTSVVAPSACTATLISTGTGNINNGTHSYKVTFINDTGETELGTISNVVTVDASNKQVALSNIPVSTSLGVTSRKIYRTKAGASDYYFLVTINNNTTTTYTDDTADASLGAINNTNRPNSTFGSIYFDEIKSLFMGSNNTFGGQYSGSTNSTGYNNTSYGAVSLRLNTEGKDNTAIGYGSLYANTTGSYNTALGSHSLYANTTGSYNTAIGNDSLLFNTGSYNTAIGHGSLYQNSTGYNNTAVGYQSFLDSTTGHDNTAIGYRSLYNTDVGFYNTAIGAYSLYYNNGVNGIGHTAIGVYSLYANTTGYYNTAMGYGSLRENTTGTYNIAFGYNAGRYITDGNTENTSCDYSIFIGRNTKSLTNNDQNEIVIGDNLTGRGSNTASWGNSSILNHYFTGKLNLTALNTDPASASAAGTLGEIRITSTYIYVCTATNTWKRVAIATW